MKVTISFLAYLLDQHWGNLYKKRYSKTRGKGVLIFGTQERALQFYDTLSDPGKNRTWRTHRDGASYIGKWFENTKTEQQMRNIFLHYVTGTDTTVGPWVEPNTSPVQHKPEASLPWLPPCCVKHFQPKRGRTGYIFVDTSSFGSLDHMQS